MPEVGHVVVGESHGHSAPLTVQLYNGTTVETYFKFTTVQTYSFTDEGQMYVPHARGGQYLWHGTSAQRCKCTNVGTSCQRWVMSLSESPTPHVTTVHCYLGTTHCTIAQLCNYKTVQRYTGTPVHIYRCRSAVGISWQRWVVPDARGGLCRCRRAPPHTLQLYTGTSAQLTIHLCNSTTVQLFNGTHVQLYRSRSDVGTSCQRWVVSFATLHRHLGITNCTTVRRYDGTNAQLSRFTTIQMKVRCRYFTPEVCSTSGMVPRHN